MIILNIIRFSLLITNIYIINIYKNIIRKYFICPKIFIIRLIYFHLVFNLGQRNLSISKISFYIKNLFFDLFILVKKDMIT